MADLVCLASLGANVYYPNDDCRYSTEHKDDIATGLRPSDYDAKHVLAVFNAVKAEYPWFKMIYCPPYYWGLIPPRGTRTTARSTCGASGYSRTTSTYSGRAAR